MNNCTNCGSSQITISMDTRDMNAYFRGVCVCGAVGPEEITGYQAQKSWDRANLSSKPSFLDRVKAFFTIRKCEECGDNIGSNTNCPECIEFRDCTAI